MNSQHQGGTTLADQAQERTTAPAAEAGHDRDHGQIRHDHEHDGEHGHGHDHGHGLD
jgi:hypothetical protein